MKRTISLFIAAILLISMIGCHKAPTWEEQYDLGVRYLSEGNYEEAVIAFTAAIEIDPKQAPAYIGRGDANMALLSADGGDEQLLWQAADDFTEAIAIDPAIVEAYSKLSDAYLELGEVDRAIKVLQGGFDATGDPGLRTTANDLTASYASVPLSIERQDISYTSELTGITSFMHYDLVTVQGEDERIGKINQAILEDFENFKTAGGPAAADLDRYSIGIKHEWMYLYLNSGDYNDPHTTPFEVNATVTCNNNGILSIRYTAHYYYDYSCEYGMTFDLLTGEQLSYMEYFYTEQEQIKTKVRTQMQTIMDEQWAMGLDGIAAVLEEDFDFSLLDFYIQNNELIVCSPRMFAGDGSVFTYAIPCGVYIEEWETDSAEPAIVSFDRKDHSIINPDGSVSVRLYYDLPVVEGDTSEIKNINRIFENIYNDYALSISEDDGFSIYGEDKPYPEEYFYTFSASVTYNRNNILSVMHEMEWFMGGVYNNGYTGEVFDLGTGRQLGLRDLFYRDDDSLLALIKDKITDFVEANFNYGYSFSIENQTATIATYTLDSLDFYIAEDGELIICIPEYELATGADGALQIPCEIYIKPQIQQSKPLSDVYESNTPGLLPVDYLGMTVGEIAALWGNDFLCGEDWYEGAAKAIYYPDNRVPYVFYYIDSAYESNPKESDIISIVRYTPVEGDGVTQITRDIPSRITYTDLERMNVEGTFYNSAENDIWAQENGETAMFMFNDGQTVMIFNWFDNHDPYTVPAEIIEFWQQ